MKTCEDINKRLQINKIVVFVVLYIEIFIISCLFTLHKNKLFHYNVFFSLKRSVGRSVGSVASQPCYEEHWRKSTTIRRTTVLKIFGTYSCKVSGQVFKS